MKLKLLVLLIIAIFPAGSAVAFMAEDLTVVNREAGISLGATLTMPESGRVKAALVLASGSGPQNRDEEVFGHKPFKHIAEFLSDHGYAVLRMDDRGVGESGGELSTTTVDDDVADIRAAFDCLDSLLAEATPRGVLGHSAGGITAVRTSLADSRCRFIVTLAAPAWKGDSVVMSQSRVLAEALTGRWDAEPVQRRLLDLVASPLPAIALKTSLYMVIADHAGAAATLPSVSEQLFSQADAISTPRYRSMICYDPAEDMRNVGVDWLALNGGRDMQVLPANLETIANLCPNAVVKELEGHNHLFQNCSSGLVSEYAKLPEDVSDETLEVILAFLDGLFGD